MNVKDAVDVGGSAFADKASIQMELERNRKKGRLTSYIRGLEIFDDIKLREVWKLLTEQERIEYKTWDTVTNDFFACRNEYSELDGAFKPVDKSVCYENIFRLMKSYEAEGKTLELKIAFDIMQADEKKSYAMRSRQKEEQLFFVPMMCKGQGLKQCSCKRTRTLPRCAHCFSLPLCHAMTEWACILVVDSQNAGGCVWRLKTVRDSRFLMRFP